MLVPAPVSEACECAATGRRTSWVEVLEASRSVLEEERSRGEGAELNGVDYLACWRRGVWPFWCGSRFMRPPCALGPEGRSSRVCTWGRFAGGNSGPAGDRPGWSDKLLLCDGRKAREPRRR